MAPISNPLYLHLHDATISDSTNMLRTRTPAPRRKIANLAPPGTVYAAKGKSGSNMGHVWNSQSRGEWVLASFLPTFRMERDMGH